MTPSGWYSRRAAPAAVTGSTRPTTSEGSSTWKSLRSLRLSLKQIGRALEDPAFRPSALVSDLIQWTEDRLAREQELLERLRVIDASAPTGWQDVLRVIELMRELNSTNAQATGRPETAGRCAGPG